MKLNQQKNGIKLGVCGDISAMMCNGSMFAAEILIGHQYRYDSSLVLKIITELFPFDSWPFFTISNIFTVTHFAIFYPFQMDSRILVFKSIDFTMVSSYF